MKERSNYVRCKSEKSHQGSEGQRTHFRDLDKDPDVHRNHDHRVEEGQQLGDHDLVVGLHEDAGEDKDADEDEVEDQAVRVWQVEGERESTDKHENDAAWSDEGGHQEECLVSDVEVGDVVVGLDYLMVYEGREIFLLLRQTCL